MSQQKTVQPPRRTKFIDILDGTLRAGRRAGLVAPAGLNKAAMLARAVEDVGHDDFGDPWFERPLDVLLDSIQGEARLNAAGDWAARQQFHHVLRDRLLAQTWFERHPEILASPIPHPGRSRSARFSLASIRRARTARTSSRSCVSSPARRELSP